MTHGTNILLSMLTSWDLSYIFFYNCLFVDIWKKLSLMYLSYPVFCHGQLYVALSRVQSKKGLHILIHDKEGTPKNTTINVVYKEVFANL